MKLKENLCLYNFVNLIMNLFLFMREEKPCMTFSLQFRFEWILLSCLCLSGEMSLMCMYTPADKMNECVLLGNLFLHCVFCLVFEK